MAVIVTAFDGGVLNGAVHPFDLPVGPWMVRFGQPVLDAVLAADLVGAIDAHPGGPAVAVVGQVSELDAVVSE